MTVVLHIFVDLLDLPRQGKLYENLSGNTQWVMGIQKVCLGKKYLMLEKLARGNTCESLEIDGWKYLLELDPHGMESQHYCS